MIRYTILVTDLETGCLTPVGSYKTKTEARKALDKFFETHHPDGTGHSLATGIIVMEYHASKAQSAKSKKWMKDYWK